MYLEMKDHSQIFKILTCTLSWLLTETWVWQTSDVQTYSGGTS